MLTLRNGPRLRTPLATWFLLVANLLVYWYALSLGETRLGSFVDLWGIIPRLLTGGENRPGVLVTPLTSMYLHVGFIHLAGNMLYLWVFGSAVERELGRSRYFLFYTACGLVAACVQVLAWPESPFPAVGASGAIAGLLAGYLVLRPDAVLGGVAPGLFVIPSVDRSAALLLGLWLLSQLLSALTTLAGSSGGAWLAHLGGFCGGLLLVIFFRPRRRRSYHCD